MVCLPWMRNVNNAPWTDQQTLYDRVVSIRRLKTVAGTTDAVGAVGYSGAVQSTSDPAGETILFTNLPASIQLASSGKARNADLPGNATQKALWNILIPFNVLPLYSVRDRDIIKDDEGYRYEVAANFWDNGYKLSVLRLEV